MPITVTHTTVATGADAGNGSIRKAQWNEAHTLSGTVDIANGGTGAATAAQALTNLAAAGITISNTFTNSRNTFGDGTADTRITINGATGTSRGVRFQTAGSPRWQAGVDTTAESGSNVGSDFVIARYDDAGVFIDTPFEIKRDTGLVSISLGSVDIGNGVGAVYMGVNGAAGNDRAIEFESNNSNRWSLVTTSTAEAGSNTGSNFSIWRYDDSGTYIDSPLQINRVTGLVYLPYIDPSSQFGVDTSTSAFVNVNAATGGQKMFQFRTAGSNRWLLGSSSTAESGSNAGSDFEIYNYSDAGSYIENPFKITRSSGTTTIKSLVVNNTIDVGNTSDTTLSRIAAGTIGVEGKSLPYVFAQSGAAVSVGAVTTETALATITIPGGALGPNGTIEVLYVITVSNNANNKTHRVRLGGIAGTAIADATLTTSLHNSRYSIVTNRNSQSSQIAWAPSGNGQGMPGVYTGALTTASLNTASSWDLVITGQKANSADTFTLEAYQVIIKYGA